MEKPAFQFGLKAVFAAIMVAVMKASGLLQWPPMPPKWAASSPEKLVLWLAAVFIELWLVAWLFGLVRYKPAKVPAFQFGLKAVFAAMTGVAVMLAIWVAVPALLVAIVALLAAAVVSVGIVSLGIASAIFAIRLFDSDPRRPPGA